MNILCGSCILLCAVAIVPNHAFDPCRGSAKCIAFDECKGMYALLVEKSAPRMRGLAKRLHCGFNADRRPLICCPPTLLFVPQSPTTAALRPTTLSSREKALRLLPSECGVDDANRIFGGQLTDVDEHPWMALLRNENAVQNGFYCGGALISSRYVLTAAHCVNGHILPRRWKVTSVRLGEWNTSSVIDCLNGLCNGPPLDVPVEQTMVHEEYDRYDSHQLNDIALLRLAYAVPFSDFVKPICLPIDPSLKKNSFEGWDLAAAGWGKTESSEFSKVKLKVNMPVVSNSICKMIYMLTLRDINENQICAGGKEGEDTCKGDSGGPLMGQVGGKWTVLGVVSYGPSPCASPQWPGVYTRVTAYVNWILAHLRP